MEYYDYLWEKANRDDIVSKINSVKSAIEIYKGNEKLLEADLTNVNHLISIELLRNESDKMVKCRQSYQRQLVRLNRLLARYDEGLRVEKNELFDY